MLSHYIKHSQPFTELEIHSLCQIIIIELVVVVELTGIVVAVERATVEVKI